MKSFLLLISLLVGLTPAYAQRGEGVRTSLKRMHELQVGKPFGEFTATAEDGSTVNNRTLAGKVTLVLFWYPSIGSSNRRYTANYLQLDTLAALHEKYADFQIISLLPDTSGLNQFRQQHPDVYTSRLAKLSSFATASDLNPGMGMPSCVLIDRKGTIQRGGWLGHFMDQAAMADKVKDLMMP